ncbi:Mitochondrial distribution and morphology protein 12 [Apophysomyces sp. BC1034]|nr:Mitochondrial distribution and morphology protein 12 [Apophysomyces sp. BC1015]KAG0176490.1 Mitochondrial distribution and morphology protein 12 [Apophysomyces sp. BC1021]KAG0187293.1 Mitochondrial distribution and morphology protein 12 [Apophysomyces sp. BC1034]
MSFDIEWGKLDQELADHVQQFLNRHFKSINKPSFIGDIEVTSFAWGSETPQVEITNITEPFPEFYEEDDDDKEDEETQQTETQTVNPPSRMSSPSSEPVYYASSASSSDKPPRLALNHPLQQQQRFNLMHSFHRSPLVAPQHPFSSSPQLHYFSPTPTSPTYSSQHYPPSSPFASVPQSRWMSRHPSLSGESTEFQDWIDDDENHHHQPHNTTASVKSTQNNTQTELDFQAHLRISYKGDMSMTVLTELRMNYPSMMFMSLPIQLCVRSVEFEATAVVAYIKSMDRVCVSMLEPEEETGVRGKDTGLESLLRDVHIESVVGDKQKQGE